MGESDYRTRIMYGFRRKNAIAPNKKESNKELIIGVEATQL